MTTYFPEDEEELPDVPDDLPEFPDYRREKGQSPLLSTELPEEE